MNKERKLALIFSALCAIVCVANMAIGIFYYLPCLVLFVVSYFINKKLSCILQVISIMVIGAMVSITQDEFCGYAIIFVSLVLFYSYYNDSSKWWLIIFPVAIFCISYFQVKLTSNKIIHAFIDMLFFSGYSLSVWVVFKDQIDSVVKKEKLDREKYIRIIDEATSVARDAIRALDKLKLDEEKKGI
jgi:hypothetical protein